MTNIESVDLNLLRVLHAVLAERSATRAAKRLHVTQSAVSNSLARLREVFRDPLVVRNARGVSATPRAQELQPELERIMRSLQHLVEGTGHFDPETSQREFTLACADYCTAIFGPALAEKLHRSAPRARLRFVPLEQLAGADGLASSIDLHVGMPPQVPNGCHSATLFEDTFVCMQRKHTKNPGRLSLKEYLRVPHVRVSVLNSPRDAVDMALAKRGLARNIVLTVPHFSVVPMMIERSGYVATLSRRLAEAQARAYAVELLDVPLNLGKRATRMVWHERTQTDPGAQFFRSLVREVCGPHSSA